MSELVLYEDDGRNRELIPGSKSKSYRLLDNVLVNKGLAVKTRGTLYIFMGASNCWGTLAVEEAQRQINDIVGNENVSVNYLPAVKPYAPYLTKSAFRIGSIPTSICIGTYRFSLTRRGDELVLTPCVDIVSATDAIEDRVTGFCVLPCDFYIHPNVWSVNDNGSLIRYLSALFVDRTELRTIMWVVGLSLVDPGSYSKFLLLYGPGGTGKSEVVNTILDIAPGCTGTIKVSQMVSSHTDMSTETAFTIASNRLATTGELNLRSGKLNLHIIKEMTGHDSVFIPPVRVNTRCSVVSSSNALPDPTEQDEWLTTAIARRCVVVPMNVKAMLLPKVERPDSSEECLDMMLACVNVYLSDEFMPMSTRSCLYSVMGSVYEKVQHEVVIDSGASTMQIVDANVHISSKLGISVEEFADLAMLRSPGVLMTAGGDKFVNHIRLAE